MLRSDPCKPSAPPHALCNNVCRTGLRLSYLPVLRNVLVKPLIQDGKEGIPVVLGMMRDYCIAREDIEFITGGHCGVLAEGQAAQACC